MPNDKSKQPRTVNDVEKDGEEGAFLRRWSARKRLAAEKNRAKVARTQPRREESCPTAKADRTDLTDADMPPLGTLDEHSDYSQFFSPKVSEELRRLALRKLFHLPAYQIRDGLNDYDEDYTHFTRLGDVVTQDMRHLLELDARRADQQTPKSNQEDPDGEERAPAPVELAASAKSQSQRQLALKSTAPEDDEDAES